MTVRVRSGPTARRLRAAWAPSLLRRLLRSRWFSSAVVLAAGAAVVVGLHGRLAAADAERAAWGSSTRVAVVAAPVSAGRTVDGSVTFVERPVAMVPVGAVTTLPDRARAAVDLVVGEVLLHDRLVGGPTGLRPAGTVAVSVTIEGAAALVEPGDLVDLWSTDVATLTSVRVVEAVVVLDRSDTTLTVAVPETSMPEVAVAAIRPLTVAHRG